MGVIEINVLTGERHERSLTQQEFDELPVLTDAQQLAQYERDLDAFLDAKAQSLAFKDRHSLALRAGYPNPWRTLGQAFGEWMDTCNALAWAGRQAILAGTKPMPASKEEFLAELPIFNPPEDE